MRATEPAVTTIGTAATDTPLFLRTETKLELLAGRWYAWPHLLAPVQQAMNIAYRYLPMLHSFVANPAVHVTASQDPMLLGGAFLDLPADAVPQVKRLIEQTGERFAALLEFARCLKELSARLQMQAKGGTLDGFYRDLPACLRGLVELAYDTSGNATILLREELIYSDLMPQASWDEVCLYKVKDSQRRMFISTPLLAGPERLSLAMSFADERIDFLARARTQPTSSQQLANVFGDEMAAQSYTLDLFTSRAPVRRDPAFSAPGVRVRYFGHACVLVQTAAVAILIDPFCAFERDAGLATLCFDDLPDVIDYVVISHGHHDHCCAELLVQIRQRVKEILIAGNTRGSLCDPSLRLILQKLGYRNIRVLEPLECVPFADGRITSVPFPGEHCGLNVQAKHCVAVRAGKNNLLFLVDSDAVDPELYVRLAPKLGPVDVLFIGMECHGAPLSWFYGPLLTKPLSKRDDESRRGNGSDFERAWRVVRELGCREVFVYALGMEPWARHLLGLEYAVDSIQLQESDRLIDACRSSGRRAERLNGCREFFY